MSIPELQFEFLLREQSTFQNGLFKICSLELWMPYRITPGFR